jgi:hypothetical protein
MWSDPFTNSTADLILLVFEIAGLAMRIQALQSYPRLPTCTAALHPWHRPPSAICSNVKNWRFPREPIVHKNAHTPTYRGRCLLLVNA